MNKVVAFFRRETVLCLSALLAVGSVFLVPPDRTYLIYIDYRTLAILYALMAVVNGFQRIGLFDLAARAMTMGFRSTAGVVFRLVFLCFFGSMVLTNDVALITFVPLALLTLGGQPPRLVLVTVVLQTIAANLGSMLTPVGNPQNLYLFQKAAMSLPAFLRLTAPYVLLSAGLLAGVIFLLVQRGRKVTPPQVAGKREEVPGEFLRLMGYLLCFALAILTVLRVLPWPGMLVTVLAVLLLLDLRYRDRVIATTDWTLLATFVFLFVFIGNLGRVPVFRELVESWVGGQEVMVSVTVSQVISNVPAALLLSGFTDRYADLIIGVNLGGLGTLIASMASLISYKQVAAWRPEYRRAYLGMFTVLSIGFLLALLVLQRMLA